MDAAPTTGDGGTGGPSDELRRAKALVDLAVAVTVLTGAGISTDSGIPDFRGPNGVWTRDPAAERASTLSAYLGDPDLRRRAWRHRLEGGALAAEPNAGHRALADLEHRRGKLHTLVTQNVDGLHLAAGTSPERLVEIHGTARDYVCWTCGLRGPMEEALERVRAGEDDPPCRRCGGILKSAAVLFEQPLDPTDLARAEAAAHSCDLLLAVGSTLSVYPAAGVVPLAKRAGAAVVILNAEPTDLDHLADVVLRGSISELLPALVTESRPAR